ncbi:aminopeptidase PepB [Permianibacter sp. IMCC34836]|uniref:aminopeptidase PepB n=1 Tax=Permianibacter fluminis TaxID=2738515 RepID=UPI001B7D8B70|nr:aminopeptidase PepB [Permianibacter fluminis]NQD39005.1 aminopeptidase PepB [Permianibacter fluminis]
MTELLQARLTTDAAASHWGKQPLLSFTGAEVLIHTGSGDDLLRKIQQAGRRLGGMSLPGVQLAGDGWTLAAQWAFALGFDNAKHSSELRTAELPAAEQAELAARLKVSRFVRDLVNETPENLPPTTLCERVIAFLEQLAPGAIKARVISGEALREAGWVGIYEVGRGSNRPPAMLQLEYCPAGMEQQPVAAALVGKGITFDSGGYSLKASEAMLTMKIDMGGAATVAGALALAILRGLNKRVALILCCAENLVSGHAYKLGDILKYKNGVSVEIVNTDAEGRLVLADGLIYACELGAPLIIDAATLTGAAVTALGTDYNAVFALDGALRSRYLGYAEQENELHWPLPLAKWHQNHCPSPYADTANSKPVKGGGPGGASNAAGFLSRFVPRNGAGWVHVDLAAAAHSNDNGMWAAGGTGVGVLTLARALIAEG